MANEKITKYLKENREKYSVEVLTGKLRSAGYPEDQIREGVRLVYGGAAPAAGSLGVKTSFWDFKSVRVHQSGGEKIIDALFGFFVVGIFGPLPIYALLRSFIVFPVVLLLEVGVILYLLRRRRFIAYGLITSSIIFFFLFGSLFGLWY